ncbi:MAG: 1-deoxy-D-xylulose-5-phosphate synthase, partial [Betaproteobacteria bacterium]|nr:1-deoxy-D-xylulose-5-phosphate synthase [Betaproteobacteria bacterium]
QGESRRRHIAVIGDGALSGGMAFEAMNHGGATRELDVLVILNDNEMSISPPVGALSHYLTRLLLGRFYGTAKALSERLLKHLPGLLALSRRLEEHVKGMLTPSTLLVVLGKQRSDIVAITAAMLGPTGLDKFEKQFPERTIDVGIAEQHAVTLAAGLACEGMKPVVAIYSTFLQRGYDQLIHDVALQNLPVTFAIDRAGLVGADGATHAGAYDIAYLRCLPNMSLLAPSDEDECRQMLYSAFLHEGPAAVRYPRGRGPGVAVRRDLSALPWGKAQIRRAGKGVVLLAFGSMLAPALVAAEALNASVVNMRFIKPLDSVLLRQMANTHEAMVTIEEGSRSAGAGAAVAEALSEMGLVKPIRMMGLPDRFIDQGDVSALLASCGLDAKGIQEQVKQWFAPYLKTIEVETEPSPALKA